MTTGRQWIATDFGGTAPERQAGARAGSLTAAQPVSGWWMRSSASSSCDSMLSKDTS